jgi:hypothetical protein
MMPTSPAKISSLSNQEAKPMPWNDGGDFPKWGRRQSRAGTYGALIIR